VATLNQNERSPLAVEDQVVQVFAATNGFLDRILTERVPEFLDGLIQRIHSEHSSVLDQIRGGDWSDETQESLRSAVAEFADDFGYDLDEEGQPLDEREVGETTREQEGIRSSGANGGEGEGDEEAAEQEEEAAAPA
jgi:F-type H+-transporting ATPase subunit alpha